MEGGSPDHAAHDDRFLKVTWRPPGLGCPPPESQGPRGEAQQFSICFCFAFILYFIKVLLCIV